MTAFNRAVTRAMRGVMRFFSRQVGNMFRSFFFGIRIWAIMAGFAISGFAGSAIKSFREFDKKLRETTSLIASETAATGKGSVRKRMQNAKKVAQQEYEAYRREMLALAVPMRQTPQGLTGGLREIVSAGYTGTGPRARGISRQLLVTAARGATAGDATVQTSANLLIQIMNALGLTSSKNVGAAGAKAPLTGFGSPERVMDRIFQAMNFGVGVTYEKIAASIPNVIGPIGAALNPRGTKTPRKGADALNQLLAAIVLGSQRGYSPQRTTVGLQDITKSIIKPTKAADELYAELGLDPSKLLQGGIIGTGSALNKIDLALKKFAKSGGDSNRALGTLFGNVRGLRVVTTLLNAGLANTNEVLKLMENSSNAATAAFDEQGRSVDGQIKRFQALFETVKVGVGISLMPLLTRAMGVGERLLNKISGGEVGLAANTAFFAARDIDKTLTAEQFASSLPTAEAEAFRRYRDFANMSVKKVLSTTFNTIGEEIGNWWNTGGKQTFTDLVLNILDTAVSALGKMLLQADDIYTFGVKLGTKIAEGALKGLWGSFQKAFGGGGGGGITGMLSSDSKLLRTDTIGQQIFGGALGLGALALLGPGLAQKGGLFGRMQLGALGGASMALGGGSSTASLIAAIVSAAIGPQLISGFNLGAVKEKITGKSVGGATAGQISMTTGHITARTVHVQGGIAGAAGAGARARAIQPGVSGYMPPVYGGITGAQWAANMRAQMTRDRLGSVEAVRQRLYGPHANVFGPIPSGPGGNAADRRRQQRAAYMERFGTPRPPTYDAAAGAAWYGSMQRQVDERLRDQERRFREATRPSRLNQLRGAGARGLNVAGRGLSNLRGLAGAKGGAPAMALGAAGLGGLSALGGGSNSMIGAALGGGLGALTFAIPGAGPAIGPIALMLGMMGGGIAGGYLDQKQAAAKAAAQDAELRRFISDARKFVGSKPTSQQSTMYSQQVPYLLAQLSGDKKGLVGKSGMATMQSTSLLGPAIQELAGAKNFKQLQNAAGKFDDFLIANGLQDSSLSSIFAGLVTVETERIAASQANDRIRKALGQSRTEAARAAGQVLGRDGKALSPHYAAYGEGGRSVMAGPATGSRFFGGAAQDMIAPAPVQMGLGGIESMVLDTGQGTPEGATRINDVIVQYERVILPGMQAVGQASGQAFDRQFAASAATPETIAGIRSRIISGLSGITIRPEYLVPQPVRRPSDNQARGAVYGARGLALGRTNVMAANGRQLVIGEDGAEAIVPLSQRVGGKGPTSGTVAVHFNGPVTFASDQDVDQVAEKLSQRLRAAMNNSTHLNSKGR